MTTLISILTYGLVFILGIPVGLFLAMWALDFIMSETMGRRRH